MFSVLGSTSAFGASDLDTRPPEMKRSTMCYWLQTCPECGYAAGQVSNRSSIDRTFLDSKPYKMCDGLNFTSNLSKAFYRHYLIMMADENKSEAFFALLHASWACDDSKDIQNASNVRGKAIEIADGLLKQRNFNQKDVVSLIRADIMRRVCRFEELLELYDNMNYDDDLLNKIVDFQRELARRKCSNCLSVKDAVKYAEGNFNWAAMNE